MAFLSHRVELLLSCWYLCCVSLPRLRSVIVAFLSHRVELLLSCGYLCSVSLPRLRSVIVAFYVSQS